MTKFNETDVGQAFIASGASRETSPEIMEAIAFFARDEAEAEDFWNGDFRDRVTPLDIWENVTNNGLHDAEDFCWGAAGSRWFSELTA
jgi:hypothetical protein